MGCFKETLTDADNFVIDFSQNINLSTKVVFIFINAIIIIVIIIVNNIVIVINMVNAIDFNQNISTKVLVFAATFLIDMMYFEMNNWSLLF